jgi:Rod binding domain-containing protein
MSGINAASALNSLPLLESTDTSRTLRNPDSDAKAVSVAQDFESVFASMLLKEMRQGLEPGSMFGKDSGDVFGGLFDRFMGEELTKGNGLGMAPMIREGIERQQRAANHTPSAAVSHAAPKIAG